MQTVVLETEDKSQEAEWWGVGYNQEKLWKDMEFKWNNIPSLIIKEIIENVENTLKQKDKYKISLQAHYWGTQKVFSVLTPLSPTWHKSHLRNSPSQFS